MAEKKKNARKKEAKIDPVVNDWKYYTARELVKVGEIKDEDYVLVQSRDGKIKKVKREVLDRDFEPVKGIRKDFF